MQSESNMPKEEKISLKNLIQGFKEWLVFIMDKRKKIVYGTLIILVLPITELGMVISTSPRVSIRVERIPIWVISPLSKVSRTT